VAVNRKGPYEFMVDTGSNLTIIDQSLAAELQLQPEGTANGRDGPAILVSPDLIDAGLNSMHPAWIAVENMTQFHRLFPELRGILGADFLRGFDVLIDREKRILCLDVANEMRKGLLGERIPIIHATRNEHEVRMADPILIAVHLLDEASRKVNLLLDSGASAPILYHDRDGHPFWSQRLKTLRGCDTGEHSMYFRLIAPQDIQIGRLTLRGVAFSIPLKSSHPLSSPAEDGLLPSSLFKRVFISYRGGFVILNPR